ncbi:Osmotin thaumatin-like protein [Mycena metata]|uniref:Osmotin thaumatin-like protein n=1 Tax=Mycena metata TaxID=1033252 RepID=A0AAD7NXC3_9AGAR|nr:Osmotin thaumatin-like protein [Mycena metata]
MRSAVFVSLVMASMAAAQRSMTVHNACPFTIWPALFTSAGGVPSQPTGWEAPSLSSVTFSVPEDWNGRIWGRRDCDFSTNAGAKSCLDGGCSGGLLCDVTNETAAPPFTLTEFTLDAGGSDFVDVSLVNGFNLPVRIDNTAGCGTPSCTVDLNANCPAAQKGPLDSTGAAVGCKSACLIDQQAGNGENSPNCCTGTHDTPATCPPTGVTNFAYFKGNCPNAIAYPYDEGSTTLWECSSSSKAAYTVTFCP